MLLRLISKPLISVRPDPRSTSPKQTQSGLKSPRTITSKL
jgi:hypothetical protein